LKAEQKIGALAADEPQGWFKIFEKDRTRFLYGLFISVIYSCSQAHGCKELLTKPF
jgi:hypothetical protein